jgi:hypothetical protein
MLLQLSPWPSYAFLSFWNYENTFLCRSELFPSYSHEVVLPYYAPCSFTNLLVFLCLRIPPTILVVLGLFCHEVRLLSLSKQRVGALSVNTRINHLFSGVSWRYTKKTLQKRIQYCFLLELVRFGLDEEQFVCIFFYYVLNLYDVVSM